MTAAGVLVFFASSFFPRLFEWAGQRYAPEPAWLTASVGAMCSSKLRRNVSPRPRTGLRVQTWPAQTHKDRRRAGVDLWDALLMFTPSEVRTAARRRELARNFVCDFWFFAGEGPGGRPVPGLPFGQDLGRGQRKDRRWQEVLPQHHRRLQGYVS